MIQQSTLDFLKKLKKNNNKEWFDKNKQLYLDAKDDVQDFIKNSLNKWTGFDKSLAGLEPKNVLFRIYRDIRFSKNKTPYKTNMGASISAGGKKTMKAGYYLHIEPGGSFLAGGIWMPESDNLKKIRQEIDYNLADFKKILNNKSFKDYFGQLDQTYKLARNPKNYEADHPAIEYLKLTSWIVWHEYKDKDVTSKKFLDEITKGAKTMKPLIDFINRAID